jgi:hypothetical protein
MSLFDDGNSASSFDWIYSLKYEKLSKTPGIISIRIKPGQRIRWVGI